MGLDEKRSACVLIHKLAAAISFRPESQTRPRPVHGCIKERQERTVLKEKRRVKKGKQRREEKTAREKRREKRKEKRKET